MNKIVIITEGGLVTQILSNVNDIEVVTIDYDKNADYEEDLYVSNIFKPDGVCGKIYKFFSKKIEKEKRIRKELKKLNF